MSIMHTLELPSHYVLEFNILAAAIVWRNDFRVHWIIVPERIELSVWRSYHGRGSSLIKLFQSTKKNVKNKSNLLIQSNTKQIFIMLV